MTKRVGVDPVPDDTQIEEWLWKKLKSATADAGKITDEFLDVIAYGREKDEPEIFAYARLENHLAKLTTPTLIRVLSAYMWWGAKESEEK